jgi:hypothetical protein
MPTDPTVDDVKLAEHILERLGYAVNSANGHKILWVAEEITAEMDKRRAAIAKAEASPALPASAGERVERTLTGESVMGLPVYAYHHRRPDGRDDWAFHWSTFPSELNAVRLFAEKDVAAALRTPTAQESLPGEDQVNTAADAYAQAEAAKGRMHTKLYRAAFIAGANFVRTAK